MLSWNIHLCYHRQADDHCFCSGVKVIVVVVVVVIVVVIAVGVVCAAAVVDVVHQFVSLNYAFCTIP